MAATRTLYTFGAAYPGSFELVRDSATSALVLASLDLTIGNVHWDMTNSGVVSSGSTIFVGGNVNGPGGIVSRTDDFQIRFDPADLSHAVLTSSLAGGGGGTVPIPLGAAAVTPDTSAIQEAYRDLSGRYPTTDELNYWTPLLADGRADIPAVRAAIVSDGALGALVRFNINLLYETYGGRDANAGELAFWVQRLREGEHYDGVRRAIVDDPLGQHHVAERVHQLYQEYGGRAPASAELAYWIGEVRNGTSYDGVRGAILLDPLGQRHSVTELGTLYQSFFDRVPAPAEVATWTGLLAKGADYALVTDSLLRDQGSDASARKLAGTPAADLFDLGTAVGHTSVSGFDIHADQLKISGTAFAGANVFDDAHAREVHSLSGSTDVLVTLGADDVLLLRDTHLSDLRADPTILA